MFLPAVLDSVIHHRMRAYYLPIAAGVSLIVSAFLPWVVVGGTIKLGGVPDVAGLWILGMGVLAVVLASLSIWTRKNSRHPLLMVGLTALGIMYLAYRLMERAAVEQAWAVYESLKILEDDRILAVPPATRIGPGIYVGLASSAVLVLFGLTIVVKKVPNLYVEEDDE
jgi:hypothetical protein